MSTEKVTVFWTSLHYQDWNLHVASTTNGLCYVSKQNGEMRELLQWLEKHLQNSVLVKSEEALNPYLHQFIEYFNGKRKDFSFDLDFHGTIFQQKVWQALCEIPYGETISYTDVATNINKPTAVRAVAAAIGANPILLAVPCHRVVGKNGALTGYRGGLDMKKQLLEIERNGN
ncbi:methylated-DNA--[protein]-cysteine S-methyltransferase [Bacillus rubiinfantis]|uniref:methylated-DNA--[protein]-cysteine S-methyltransferase n=1 Tax=Bacillus rubiinfantis TaxID=1499680 RepID=UPI0005AA418F|nr:methylated-DNA--[protein]-cysteine S-methyltransferase [Bacillus rubiinfantis]